MSKSVSTSFVGGLGDNIPTVPPRGRRMSKLTSGWTRKRQVRCGSHWALELPSTCTFSLLCPGEESSDLIRHFLIESSAKGVHLKGADEEPYFGESLWPSGPWVSPSPWARRVVWEGLLTQGCLFFCREPLCLCVPAFYHGPGPALQTLHPAERWVWTPGMQQPSTGSVCSH